MQQEGKRKRVQTEEERREKAKVANRNYRVKKKQRLEELEQENQQLRDEVQRLYSVYSTTMQKQEVIQTQHADEWYAWEKYRAEVEARLHQQSQFLEEERRRLEAFIAETNALLQQRTKALAEEQEKLKEEKRKWVERLLVVNLIVLPLFFLTSMLHSGASCCSSTPKAIRDLTKE